MLSILEALKSTHPTIPLINVFSLERSNKKFVSSGGWLKNSDSYESWQIFYKDKDEKYECRCINHHIVPKS